MAGWGGRIRTSAFLKSIYLNYPTNLRRFRKWSIRDSLRGYERRTHAPPWHQGPAEMVMHCSTHMAPPAVARVARQSGDRAHALIGLSLRVSRECGLTPLGEIVSAACEETNGVGQSDQREQPQVFVSVSLQVAASPAIACE